METDGNDHMGPCQSEPKGCRGIFNEFVQGEILN